MSPTDDPVQTLYDALAPFYRKLVGPDDPEIATILSKLPDRPGRALDLGCGVGRLAVPMACAGWQVHGLDLSSAMVAEANAYASEMGVCAQVTCAVKDFSDPSNLPDGPFDVIIAIGSLFHVTNDDVLTRVLNAVAVRLRQNGLYIMDMETDQSAWVSEPDVQDVEVERGALRIRKLDAHVVETGRTSVHLTFQNEGSVAENVKMHTRWSDEDEFRQRLSDAGLQVLEVQPDWGGARESGLLYTARRF